MYKGDDLGSVKGEMVFTAYRSSLIFDKMWQYVMIFDQIRVLLTLWILISLCLKRSLKWNYIRPSNCSTEASKAATEATKAADVRVQECCVHYWRREISN
jgi:hypothetical protein